jgi:hypothetical protein
VFARLTQGHALVVKYEINGNPYNKVYYFADGIYPMWSLFMMTISDPTVDNKSYFAKCHEACRKDVKRTFDMLQHRLL